MSVSRGYPAHRREGRGEAWVRLLSPWAYPMVAVTPRLRGGAGGIRARRRVVGRLLAPRCSTMARLPFPLTPS